RLTVSQESTVVQRSTDDVEANDLYLKGRYLTDRGGRKATLQALQFFEAAIEKDSSYALAQAGLADVYYTAGGFNYLPARDALARSERAARREVQLDDRLAEA